MITPMKNILILVLLILVGALALQAQPMDVTTQLTKFLTDLRAGTLGVNNPIASLKFSATVFANLATVNPTNGGVIYCSDCTIANPCNSGGSGAIAKRLNGVQVCN